jgi:hypothetical protein
MLQHVSFSRKSFLALVLGCAVGLSGCATTSEECTRRVVAGTGIGALGGAAVGAAVGGATGGASAGRGALWGAGAGAVTGGVVAGLTCTVPSGSQTVVPEPLPPYQATPSQQLDK